jgi:peptide/nickel transport system ATP-binding protein
MLETIDHNSDPVVQFDRITIDYDGARAVEQVELAVRPGEILGIVGESGCGKSTLVTAVLGGLRGSGRLTAGVLSVAGSDIGRLSRHQLDLLRWSEVALVPQNPAQALAPHRRVGAQFDDVLEAHGWHGDRRAHAADLFRRVGLPEPATIGQRYPHQLSGGQQQRVCIALALALHPRVIVLDEPTTGLDVTTQRQIIELLRGIRDETRAAMLYVTHDLALLATIADRIAVLYAGHLVETGPTAGVLHRPHHPYTRGLIASVQHIDPVEVSEPKLQGALRRDELPEGCPFTPRCRYAMARCASEQQALREIETLHRAACLCAPLPPIEIRSAPPRPVIAATVGEAVLHARDLTVTYLGAPRPALRSAGFSLHPGEVLAIVGESGSGKSTLARVVMGLVPPVAGSVALAGVRLAPRTEQRPREVLRALQFIFQNPDDSLNPRQSVGEIVARPARLLASLGRREATERALEALAAVQLDPAYMYRMPTQLSGGERQRVAIARALVVEPRVLVCDEILSALDASVQAQIIGVLDRLRRESGVAILFITHDLAVVRSLADRVAVIHRGEIVEEAATAALFRPPHHPYTEALLAAAPRLHSETAIMQRAANERNL